MPKTAKNAADYILPLYMNGLSGRMLRMPPAKGKKREILVIYGHHSSLERWFGITKYLSKYGAVTMPDLPGFGGMESFYKIGGKPTIDNMADYLAAFIKLRYKNKKFVIAGLSIGFVIVTRMLQKYPELTKRVTLLVSFSGFVHKDGFNYKWLTLRLFRGLTAFLSLRLPAAFVQHILFRRIFIIAGYKYLEKFFVKDQFSKLRDSDKKEWKERVDFEVHLWQCNEVRTYMKFAHAMLTLDVTGKHIALPVYHLAVDTDRYFSNVRVEQHMRRIYKDFHLVKTKAVHHAPSVIMTEKDAAPYFPSSIRSLLSKKSTV